MIQVPFKIVANNKTDNRFVFNFETPEEARSFLKESYFKQDPDDPSIMMKTFTDKKGKAAIAFAILPEITGSDDLSGYEISSLEPEVL